MHIVPGQLTWEAHSNRELSRHNKVRGSSVSTGQCGVGEWRELAQAEGGEPWCSHNRGLSEASQGAALELGCLSRGITSWCKEIRPLLLSADQSLDSVGPGKWA